MQSRLGSFLEQVLNTTTGFVLTFLIIQNIGPVLGCSVNPASNLALSSILAVASVTKGYLWRRYFNGRAISAKS